MTGPLVEALRPSASAAFSFDAIYEAEFDYVYRVLTRLVGASEAEDLVQEVFLVVHRRLPEYRGDARLTTWLFRIAYHVAGAYVRRERLRRRLSSLFGIEAKIEAECAHAAEGFAEVERVRSALQRLSFEKRSALVLYEVEGWSCQEIADSVGVPVGTVHTRLHHARRDFARACQHPIAHARRGT
ncbi:MAG TPA: RNA polymerase sigma factor [Polyangiaceae bacterium]